MSERDGAAVKFPPPVVGVLTILIGYLLGRVVPIFAEFGFPAPARYWIGGAIVLLSGLVLGLWPSLHFRDTGQDVTPWSTTPELVILGPYRFTRNPMYLMMLLVCIGFAFILAEAWVLILTPACAAVIYLIAIRHEEAYLEEKFGASYCEYKENVRRWI